MKKSKSIDWEKARADLLTNPEVQAAYEAEVRKLRLQAMLAEWRSHEGLTRAQVAERMGVTPPTVSRMEANIIKASIETVVRYAKACGVKHPKIIL